MRGRGGIQIEGLKELDKAFSELPRATGKSVLRRVLMKRAQSIADEAQRLAPRSEGQRTIHLQDTLAASTKLSRRQAKEHKKESAVEVFAGAGALPQAHLQEFGTSHHAPQPFMRPAWDSGKNAALDGIRDDLASEIEKARKRLARKAERLAAKMKAGV